MKYNRKKIRIKDLDDVAIDMIIECGKMNPQEYENRFGDKTMKMDLSEVKIGKVTKVEGSDIYLDHPDGTHSKVNWMEFVIFILPYVQRLIIGIKIWIERRRKRKNIQE